MILVWIHLFGFCQFFIFFHLVFLLFVFTHFIQSSQMFSPVVNNFISEQAAVVASNNIHGMPSSYSYHFRPNISSSSSSSSSFLATCRRRSQDITGQIKHLIQLPTSSSSSVKFSSGSRRPSLPAILLSIRKEFFMNLECICEEKEKELLHYYALSCFFF